MMSVLVSMCGHPYSIDSSLRVRSFVNIADELAEAGIVTRSVTRAA